jgi:hypothetical protein
MAASRKGPLAIFLGLAAAWLLATAAPAAAEDLKIFEVTGEADAAASDSRGVAVDAAFARATEDALEDLLSKAQRAEQRATLNKEIVGRARRWVASYKVTADQTAGGRRQLTVAVRINREALRARLAELAILPSAGADPGAPAGDPAAPGDPITSPPPTSADPLPTSPSSSADPRWAGRTATLLLYARRQAQGAATFGASGEADAPGATVASSVMAERGLVVKPASLAGPAPRGEGELPLDDGQARAMAAASKAELAVVVGVELSPRQYVRGIPTSMVLATATARVVARGEGAEGEGKGSAVAAAGDGDRQAIERAVATAVASALPTTVAGRAAEPQLTTDDQPLPAADGGAWVRVSSRTSWSAVSTLLRAFAKQKGFSAELRRLSPAGYLVLVRADSGLDRAAAIARSAQLPEGAGVFKVRSERGLITVRVEAP